MDWTTLSLFYIVLLTTSTLPGLCEQCPDNCMECGKGNKCNVCKWLYGGDRCEKKCIVGFYSLDSCDKPCYCNGVNFEEGCDIESGTCRCKQGWSTTTCNERDTSFLNTTVGETSTLGMINITRDPIVNTTMISRDRPVPLFVVVASVIGVTVFIATFSVCIVCLIKKAHRKISTFGNGTESQNDIITSKTDRSEYSYVDVPDNFNTSSHTPDKTESNNQQEGTKARRNRSVPGGTFVYDTVTDELILIDKSRKNRKKNHSRKRADGQKQINLKNNNLHVHINNRSRKRKSSGEDNSRFESHQGDPYGYNSFSELAKKQKPGIGDDSNYSHLETARGNNGDLYNTFSDLAEERADERVSPVFEYAHLSSVFEGKPGSYSYVGVKPIWTAQQEDVDGNYHHMANNI
ncbi:uncharacterized protein LOC132553796 [Ylistrum balloti]|uniref:uncharacterized protein LOC132553796 n=1 Tax=Ylistrum balloti TaxID=509963 RepID=UPI002905A4A1|nr:uncharacterized protein LOC132553796 [Ylistrum balloti]